MNRGSSRRRLRLRRKRKGETFASRLSDAGDVESPRGSARRSDPTSLPDAVVEAAEAGEVVGHMGCCVVEAIGSAAVLVALLAVPAYLLIR